MSSNREESLFVAVYRDQAAAEAAVQQLEDLGLPAEDISLLGNENEVAEAALGRWNLSDAAEHGLKKHGAVLGFAVGSGLGMAEGLAIFFVPGLGINALFGPILGFLAGGIIGSLYGLIAGHFETMDVSAKYRARLITGQFLVSVACKNGEGNVIQRRIRQTRPREIETFPVIYAPSVK